MTLLIYCESTCILKHEQVSGQVRRKLPLIHIIIIYKKLKKS